MESTAEIVVLLLPWSQEKYRKEAIEEGRRQEGHES